MTEKIIFAYELFFAIKYFRFNFFVCVKIATPPPPPPLHPSLKKVTSLFPSNPSLKVKVLPSLHFLKIWLEVQSRNSGKPNDPIPRKHPDKQ